MKHSVFPRLLHALRHWAGAMRKGTTMDHRVLKRLGNMSQTDLARITMTSTDWRVRAAAAERLTDEDQITRVLFVEKDERVLEAIGRALKPISKVWVSNESRRAEIETLLGKVDFVMQPKRCAENSSAVTTSTGAEYVMGLQRGSGHVWNMWKGVEFDVTPLNDHSDCHAMIFMKSSDLIGLPRPPIMGEEQIGAYKEQNREASKIPILDLEKIGCKQSCVLCARCYMQGSEEGDFRLTCTYPDY